MDKVMQSNPILEAFGNSRTLRNDNSSRFGKYIDLNFTKRGHLVGGTIKTYLLEKVRLSFQQSGERNFHVFYQMFAGASIEDKERWNLMDSVKNYRFTNQGNIFDLKFVFDKDEYNSLRKALNVLNFDIADQDSLFNILAGLLHLGQIQFEIDHNDSEGSEVVRNDLVLSSVELSGKLLGVPVDLLIHTITVRKIIAHNEVYEKKLTPEQASDARDALAKAIYGRLFDWIVTTTNRSIKVDPSVDLRADIGVLDIFGFECFQNNSFEQLCINYTNETLQQQFNQFVFKMEQIEYKKEKIEWSFIEFPDNQDCLDLIEQKTTGIFSMLDDECRLPKGSDEKFASRMSKAYESNNRFSATTVQKRDSKFCINHYAGVVVYTAYTFVEKNKDEFPKDAAVLMKKSSDNLMHSLFSELIESSNTLQKDSRRNEENKITSVCSQFKDQLLTLMDKIYTTKPHYIRCLKPNDYNSADNFNRLRTTEQLRYSGVLEAVRVARSGFPVRLSHNDFFNRYRPLANPLNSHTSILPRILGNTTTDPRTYCETLLETLIDESINTKTKIAKENLQLGISKVFLRKSAHDVLEGRRSRRIINAVKFIQRIYRGYLIRFLYLNKLWALKTIQRYIRGTLSRAKVENMRCEKSAIIIQSHFRSHYHYFRFFFFKHSLITIQSLFRRNKAKSLVNKIFAYNKNIILIQCLFRKRKSRKLFLLLRKEAKDVGFLQQSNNSLKAEIEEVRRNSMLEAKRLQEIIESKRQNEAFEKDHEIKKVELIIDKTREDELISLQKELAMTKLELENERNHRIDLENQLAVTELKLLETSIIPSSYSSISQTSQPRNLIQVKTICDSNQVSLSDVTFAVTNSSIIPSLSSDMISSSPKTTPTSNNLTPVSVIQSESNDNSSISKLFPSVDSVNCQPLIEPESSLSVSSVCKELSSIKDSLTNERLAKEFLEEEVVRLRHISLDLTAQLENLKRSPSIPNRRSEEISTHRRRSSIQRGGGEDDVDVSRSQIGVSRRFSRRELAAESKDSSDARDNSLQKQFGDRDQDIMASIRELPTKILNESTSIKSNGIDVKVAMNDFDRNVKIFKDKILKGISGHMWCGNKISNQATVMKLLEDNITIIFQFTSRKFSFAFGSNDLAPIRIDNLSECISGSGGIHEFDSTMITIVTKNDRNSNRSGIIFKLSNKEEQKIVLTGLRTLISDVVLIQSPTLKALRSLDSANSKKSTPNSASTASPPPRSPPKVIRQSRRLSLRDVVLDQMASNKGVSQQRNISPSNEVQKDDLEGLDNIIDVKKQLLLERVNYERLMMQSMNLTNDITDRESHLVAAKSREADLKKSLLAKEKMYEQDAIMRMQLGKRLEQVLMDKEEACEQLEILKYQLHLIRSSLH
jgi:myosin-5